MAWPQRCGWLGGRGRGGKHVGVSRWGMGEGREAQPAVTNRAAHSFWGPDPGTPAQQEQGLDSGLG